VARVTLLLALLYCLTIPAAFALLSGYDRRAASRDGGPPLHPLILAVLAAGWPATLVGGLPAVVAERWRRAA
jgi:hypothetical protein